MGLRIKAASAASGHGKAFGCLGNSYREIGHHAKAIELLEQSLSILEEVGDRAGQGQTCYGLANCYREMGQYNKAIELFEQALSVFKDLGHRADQAKALNCLGNFYREMGQNAKAIEQFEQALVIDEDSEVGNRVWQGMTLNGLVSVCVGGESRSGGGERREEWKGQRHGGQDARLIDGGDRCLIESTVRDVLSIVIDITVRATWAAQAEAQRIEEREAQDAEAEAADSRAERDAEKARSGEVEEEVPRMLAKPLPLLTKRTMRIEEMHERAHNVAQQLSAAVPALPYTSGERGETGEWIWRARSRSRSRERAVSSLTSPEEMLERAHDIAQQLSVLVPTLPYSDERREQGAEWIRRERSVSSACSAGDVDSLES